MQKLSREFKAFLGLVLSFLVASALLGILKIQFPQNIWVALPCIAFMLGLWAYVMDFMLRHLREKEPKFYLYIGLYFVLSALVIGGFGLFMDPGPLSLYGDNLPDSILASARAFCSGDETILTHFPAWRLIPTAEAIIGYSLIALVFGAAMVQQGFPRLVSAPAKPSRKKGKKIKAKFSA